MNDLEISNNTTFESIKHIDEEGKEFWYARELQISLEYKEWRKFNNVITKTKKSCELSNNYTYDHFVQLDKMVMFFIITIMTSFNSF